MSENETIALPSCMRRPIQAGLHEYVAWVGDLLMLTVLAPVMLVWHRAITSLVTAADGKLHYNIASPTRNRAFLQWTFDLALEGKTHAQVYDVGGTGQVKANLDRRGRIAQALDINIDPLVDAPLRNIREVPAGSADLLIMSGAAEYMDDHTLVEHFRACLTALRPGAPLVLASVSKSLFPWLNRFLLRRWSVVATKILRKQLNFRPQEELVALMNQAGFDARPMPRRYHHFCGAGSAYIVVARRPVP